eukprot:1149674-Pelagomonas_calceolata.AAC.1
MFTCSHHARHTPCLQPSPIILHSSSPLPSPLLLVLFFYCCCCFHGSKLGPCLRELDLPILHGAGCFGARPEEQLAETEQLWRLLCGGLL